LNKLLTRRYNLDTISETKMNCQTNAMMEQWLFHRSFRESMVGENRYYSYIQITLELFRRTISKRKR